MLKALLVPAVAVLWLTACGQTGPLVLPERAPQAAPPPAAPAKPESAAPQPDEKNLETPERRRGAATPSPETP